ncbi:hypothetical protein TURU_127569 [Turdus rufiventris]|nr:hypothetical protein TURU_127569 [Turdus rufiventris]
MDVQGDAETHARVGECLRGGCDPMGDLWGEGTPPWINLSMKDCSLGKSDPRCSSFGRNIAPEVDSYCSSSQRGVAHEMDSCYRSSWRAISHGRGLRDEEQGGLISLNSWRNDV